MFATPVQVNRKVRWLDPPNKTWIVGEELLVLLRSDRSALVRVESGELFILPYEHLREMPTAEQAQAEAEQLAKDAEDKPAFPKPPPPPEPGLTPFSQFPDEPEKTDEPKPEEKKEVVNVSDEGKAGGLQRGVAKKRAKVPRRAVPEPGEGKEEGAGGDVPEEHRDAPPPDSES